MLSREVGGAALEESGRVEGEPERRAGPGEENGDLVTGSQRGQR